MDFLKRRLFWILLVLVTGFYGVVYVSVQQALRLGANEPQRSMAQDVAKQLDEGRKPEDLLKQQIDMGSNMAPFVIVYDKYGAVVAGDGYINGTIPQVPIGVLAATQGHKINSVTWQPTNKVRIASVGVEANSYYILSGRSLSVVEDQISSFGKWLAAAWFLSIVLLSVVYRFIRQRFHKPAPVKSTE
jgi:hypothetical protein